MRKKHFVTRRIKSTTVKALTYNTKTKETEEKEFSLARTYKNDESLLQQLRESFETETVKIATILEKKEEMFKHVMDENEFVHYAIKVPIKKDDEELDDEELDDEE